MNVEQQNQQNLDSLMRLIRRAVKAEKFALCFANCSSLSEQNHYMAELRQHCGQEEITLVDVSLWNRGTITNLRPIVHETLKTQFPDGELPKKLAIQVSGLEISILLDPDEQFPAVLQSMNMGREGFVAELPCPFLLWLPDYAYTKLIHVAPDFWSVRYGSFEFCSDKDVEQTYDLDQLPTEKQDRTLWRDKQDQIPLIERILETQDRQTTPQVDTDLRLKLAAAYHFLGKIERARQHYEEALQVSRELDDVEREGAARNGLGVIYMEIGELSQAIECFERYLELRQQQGKEEAQAVGYNHLGLVYDRQGRYEEAIKSYQQALNINQKFNNFRATSDVLGNLGLVYRKLGKFDEALDYHQQALQISRSLQHTQSEVQDLGNIGLVYHELQDYEKAIQHYTQALRLSSKHEYKQDELNQYFNLGNTYRNSNNQWEQAKEMYVRALELSKSIGKEEDELLALESLRELYCHESFANLEQELSWTEKFIERTKKSGNIANWLYCAEKLVESCHRQNLREQTKRGWLFNAEALVQKALKQNESKLNTAFCLEKLIGIYNELGLESKISEYQQELNSLRRSQQIHIWLEPGTVEVKDGKPILQILQPYTFFIQVGSQIPEYAWEFHQDFQYANRHEEIIPDRGIRREGFKVSYESIEKEKSETESSNNLFTGDIPPSEPPKISLKSLFITFFSGIVFTIYHGLQKIRVTIGKTSKERRSFDTIVQRAVENSFKIGNTFSLKFEADGIHFNASKKELVLIDNQYCEPLNFTAIAVNPEANKITINITTEDQSFQEQIQLLLHVEGYASTLEDADSTVQEIFQLLENKKSEPEPLPNRLRYKWYGIISNMISTVGQSTLYQSLFSLFSTSTRYRYRYVRGLYYVPSSVLDQWCKTRPKYVIQLLCQWLNEKNPNIEERELSPRLIAPVYVAKKLSQLSVLSILNLLRQDESLWQLYTPTPAGGMIFNLRVLPYILLQLIFDLGGQEGREKVRDVVARCRTILGGGKQVKILRELKTDTVLDIFGMLVETDIGMILKHPMCSTKMIAFWLTQWDMRMREMCLPPNSVYWLGKLPGELAFEIQALMPETKLFGEKNEQQDIEGFKGADIQIVVDRLKKGESLEGAELRGLNLRGIELSHLNLNGANLQGADLRGANLSNSVLQNANLESTNLRYANLSGANLANANMEDCDLARTILYKTCFKNAILRRADLRAASIDNADFTNADLQGAGLIGATKCLAYSFKLTEQFFSGLGRARLPETQETIPEEIIKKLYNLKDIEFRTKKEFLVKLKKTIGIKAFSIERYRVLILRHAYATLSRKFQGADLRGSTLAYTGLDANDLRLVGAKIDSDTAGLSVCVFDYFRI